MGGTIPPVTPSTPSGSDLVTLGILTKPISEFSNSDIGTTVLIPYNDPTGKILLNDGKIEFEVVGVNHHTTTEYPKTITLMTKNIIRLAAFDAEEPYNELYDDEYGGFGRMTCGNNRWSVSNIRQWLNSSGAANSWFTAQHDYDEAPTSDKVSGADGAYANAPGFLAGFSANVLQHFTDITNTTALCSLDGGGSETTFDKVFLPSYTEMSGNQNNGIAEGAHLFIRYPDDESRLKNSANGIYWMRSPANNNSFSVWRIYYDYQRCRQ